MDEEYVSWATEQEAYWQEYRRHLGNCPAGCYCTICETEKRNVTGH